MPFRPCWLVPVAWLVLSTPPVWPQQPDWDRPFRLGGEDLRSVTAWLRKNNPDPVPVHAIDKQAVDSTYSILVAEETAQWRKLATSPPAELLRPGYTGVFVVYGKTNQVYMVLEVFRSEDFRGLFAQIQEARRDSVLIEFFDSYGGCGASLKYVYDLDKKRIDSRLRFCRMAFDPPVRADGRLYYKSRSECGHSGMKLEPREFIVAVEPRAGVAVPGYQFVKAMPSAVPATTVAPAFVVEAGGVHLSRAGAANKFFPVAVPSLDEYTKLRGNEARGGWRPTREFLKNQVGPIAVDGTALWFANTFYDGEGITGVGGIGRFDLMTGEYKMRHFPQIARWSGSWILLEGDDIWVGLVCRPEGAPIGGGLLRYNRVTGEGQRYEFPGVISSIDRAGDTLYLATSIGLYLFRNDSLTLMRLEPVAKGRWDMVVRDVRSGR
jgi:hypothetical protein